MPFGVEVFSVPRVIKPLIFSALTRKPNTSRVAAEVGFLIAN